MVFACGVSLFDCSVVTGRNLDSGRLIVLGSLKRRMVMISKVSCGLRVFVYRRWLLLVCKPSQCCGLHLAGHGSVGTLMLILQVFKRFSGSRAAVYPFSSSCIPLLVWSSQRLYAIDRLAFLEIVLYHLRLRLHVMEVKVTSFEEIIET
ncbi:hypothetical protein HA466_0043620 [Hirschfeldia incana]|nr:hypothetical protein HA466_0043620 [Hirschfeldia incana]